MSISKQKIWVGVGVVLLLLGGLDVVDGLFGTGRLGAGKLFYDAPLVDELVARAGPAAVTFARVCGDKAVEDRFDSRSIKHLERWCRAVETFQQSPSGDTGVALMRANNRTFERITDKLFLAGGDLGQLGLDIMTARSTFRPAMEKVGSIRAGASFSETLIGLFLLIGAWYCLRRGRRSPR
jgi:hypothetical protein